MKIKKEVDLKEYSTMRIGGKAKYLLEIENEADLVEAAKFAKQEKMPIFPIGDGSNIIFSDKLHEKVFLNLKISDVIKTYDSNEFVNVSVGGGMNWDEFVKWTTDQNLSGLEALSGIPGTVGASPIQNIGAYGHEVNQNITSVRVFNLETETFEDLSNEDCDFQYRGSFFKDHPGKFIVVRVNFQLYKKPAEIPQYKDVQIYFVTKQKTNPTVSEIRDAIIEIRNSKLPDPKIVPNNGSFFKNAVVESDVAEKILGNYPNAPHFPLENNLVKIPAGWLIENSIDDESNDLIKTSDKHKLVLTNPDGRGTFKDLETKAARIKKLVQEKFGIELEVEPNIIY